MKGMNLPNKLTILRILLVPLIVLCFYLPASWGMWEIGRASCRERV